MSTIEETECQAVADDGNTSIDPDPPRPNCLRWHMFKDGKTFIMYGPQLDVMARAIEGGYTDVTASGHYSYETNTIVDPQDGPTSLEDFRRGS